LVEKFPTVLEILPQVLRGMDFLTHTVLLTDGSDMVTASDPPAIRSKLYYAIAVSGISLTKLFQTTCCEGEVIMWVPFFEGQPPKIWEGQKNFQISARFLITFDFDREYLHVTVGQLVYFGVSMFHE